jgi:preprotein translocase subunit SecD
LFVVAFTCAYLLISRRIPLGLDLRGGAQMVLAVITDDVIKAETQTVVETVQREILKDTDVPTKVWSTGLGEIQATGVTSSALEGRVTGWDAVAENQPGIARTKLKMRAERRRMLAEEATVQTMRVIQNRLNGLGVSEIAVQRYGDPGLHQIQIEFPGISDPRRIQTMLQSTGVLEFRMVDRGPFETAALALDSYGGRLPSDLEILPYRESDSPAQYYVIRRAVSLAGRYVRTATPSRDPSGRPAVAFTLNPAGAEKFGSLTANNIGKYLAIVLDGIVQSAPQIESRIDSNGIIQGGSVGFSPEQARDLAVILRTGSLPARTQTVREKFIGPSLGEDSIRAGIIASAVALVTVSGFVVAYYRMAGVNAVVAMLLNLLILLAAMAYFAAPLTLPGIAGIVLTIGVGIDSNVLIFERIREELRAGKSSAAAITTGFQRVFRTLVDTHLAAMISAAILFMFSSGTVKGFAVTLAIGLLSNLFTSVFVSRTLFECVRTKRPLSI